MDTLKSVIEQAMKRTGSATPYALAVHMGLKPNSRVSAWQRRERWPSEKEAAVLAQLAGVQFGEVIAIMEMEKAKTPEDRAFWRKFKAHGIAAGLALLGLAAPALLATTASAPAQAETVRCIHYRKYAIRLKNLLKAPLSGLFYV